MQTAAAIQRTVASHLPRSPAITRQTAPAIENTTLATEIAFGVTRVAAMRRASACAQGFSRVFRYRRAPVPVPLSGMRGCSTCAVISRNGSESPDVSHVYNTAGSFVVKVSAADGKGGT